MIILNGRIKTSPEDVRALAADLVAGVARTRKEDGCIEYGFALEDAEAGTILVIERWRDQASLDTHLATPEIAELFGKWGGRFEAQVRMFDASNERGMGE
ncbi:putative quinol monooxygenase [Sphingomonas profundi]|uniref:putative quinol monooxygenase n=1 Tax=Alterirhizorhabdus profundi TaxID=2681549 RepID=UPI0012E8D2EF|nr:putative quinol monooxygenase [Sphingomonas profundi]